MSCSPQYIDTWDAWQIDKGEHTSHRIGLMRAFPSIKTGSLVFDAYFTEECLYDISQLGNDAGDINKLYGISNLRIHENSARFGWRHNGKGKIEIFAYWYNNGERFFEKVGETIPYTKDYYQVSSLNDSYIFTFNNVEILRDGKSEGVKFRCFPYFGGNPTAPQTMRIFIYEHKKL